MDVGQTVAASLQAPTLFTIAQDLTKMQVDTNVDEADVGRVKVGLRASFTVDSFPGQVFAGEIVQIRKAPQVVQNVVTYDVVVSAQNPEQKLLPGMTANVRIVTDQKEGVLQRAECRAPLPARRRRGRPAAAGRRSARAGRTGRPWRAAERGRGGGPGISGRVFIVGPDGKPEARRRSGSASRDGTYTEVARGASSRTAGGHRGRATTPRPATTTAGPARGF